MRDISFLVFSDDWGRHPSSSQHLFREIGRRHDVVWVNTLGMRRPRLSRADLCKVLEKTRSMVYPAKEGQAMWDGGLLPVRLSLCVPAMLPYARLRAVRMLNRYACRVSVGRELARRRMGRPVIVATVPNACDYVGDFDEQRVVYYCVDDYSEWPGIDKDLVLAMEGTLIRRADLLIATSTRLQEKLQSDGRQVELLAHGVDFELFSSKPQSELECLAKIPSPRVGYFGLFDARTDQRLLARVVGRLRDVSFVIAGPVDVEKGTLGSNPNVHFVGRLPYESLPRLVAGLSALIIPYKLNELMESVAPLKLKEYLATSKPVISTPLAEVERFRDVVVVAESVDAWVAAIEAACRGELEVSQRAIEQLLSKDSWASRADRLLRLLE